MDEMAVRIQPRGATHFASGILGRNKYKCQDSSCDDRGKAALGSALHLGRHGRSRRFTVDELAAMGVGEAAASELFCRCERR